MPARNNKTSIYRGDRLLTSNIPDPEPLLVNIANGFSILTRPSMIEIFGQTGTGKSMFTTGLGLALATAGEFMGWQAPKACRVLYVDGEMPGGLIVGRTRDQARHRKLKPADLKNLAFMARDWHRGIFHRLDTPEGQATLKPFFKKTWNEEDEHQVEEALNHLKDEGEPELLGSWSAEVVIFDNAVTLFDPAAELDAAAWMPGQDFLVRLRDRGITSILVHHAGRQGDDGRGHSSRDDLMDTIIRLKHPPGWKVSHGCKFDLSFTKGRALYGDAAGDMKCSYKKTTGWDYKAAAPQVDGSKFSFAPVKG